MDDSDLALEQALHRLGGGENDLNEMEEESSDSEVDSSQGGREGAEIPSDSERTMTRECLYSPRAQDLSSSYHSRPHSQQRQRISENTRSVPVSVSTSCVSELPISLRTIIEDDRTFLMFRRFLKDQCITRNLNFWLACEHYRHLSPDNGTRLSEVAQAVYAKFIKCSAPQRVTILDRTKKQIKISLEYRIPLTPSLFETAQSEIWRIMEKNEMRQFLVSDAFADCSVFTNLESTVFSNAMYSPSMAQPAYGVCGGGSLQQSGSEDSASITSGSDAGPRSAVIGPLTRPYPTSNRNAMSDTEGSRHHRAPSTGPHITKDKPVSQEDFVAMVSDRLMAVQKDRDAMRRRVQDRARKQGRTYEEIMALEWFDLPESFKFLNFKPGSSVPGSNAESNDTSLLRPPSVRHVLSPVKNSPSPYNSSASMKQPQQSMAHINSLAMREVQDALKDLEITNEVHKKQRSHGRMTGSGCSSSIFSTTSDSGVGDTWVTSGLVTPSNNDRLRAYLQKQNFLANSMPERDAQAHAAAIALISNSPHPDALNPQVPVHVAEGGERQRRPHQLVRNFPGAYSSDDSSSCFTMTSKSSTSDLFIPRRIPHPHSVYSDSDEPHHYGSRYHRRQLSTPKRSHQLTHKHTPAGPPIAEQRMAPPQRHGGGDVLVVYHLDDFPTPFAKRIGSADLTLGTFKDKVFARKGDYRFFFKRYCEDLGMEIMEEYSDDMVTLPLTQGKVIGRVEKVT